jgi:hypothetical protein
METGEFTQATIALIEWSWDISDIIWNPFTSSEWIIANVIQSPIRFRMALTIFLLRLAALIRVVKDSNARSSSFWFQLLAVFLVIAFTPIFWILLYIAIRPQWWKWDKTPRRYTMFLNTQICENCWEFNQLNNSYCTSCWENLHISCRECSSKYSKSYSYCPNCWAPHLEE